AKKGDLAVRRAKEKHVFLTIFAPGRLYAPFGSDLPHRAIGVGERINTNVREQEVFNRTPEPLDVRLNRLATFEATGMSERWRKWKFPKDVIGDERLPFSRAEKRFNVALQKRGGDGHARSPFRAETTLVAPLSAMSCRNRVRQIQTDVLPGSAVQPNSRQNWRGDDQSHLAPRKLVSRWSRHRDEAGGPTAMT